VRAVFLLLDADLLVTRPFTNRHIQALLPPGVTGENPARFWWRNLTAIQFEAWRSAIRDAGKKPPEFETRDDGSGLRRRDEAPAPIWTEASREQPPKLVARIRADSASAEHARRREAQSYFFAQMTRLERFVALCRERDIKLAVAISPPPRGYLLPYDARDVPDVADQIARIAPVWDFGGAHWLSNHPELWTDAIHFSSGVGRIMLRRMFGRDVPDGWKDFGRRLPN
jgi:hypothetical protein